MSEFDEDIKRIKEREALAERIEAYLRSFKERWLRKMVKEANTVLERKGRAIKSNVEVLPTNPNLIEAVLESYNRINPLEPKIHKVISSVEDVFDTCMALLHTDWSGDGMCEMLPIEKKQYRDIVAICKKYREKYVESDYEDEIRRLIADMGGIIQVEELNNLKSNAKFISKTETIRAGAITQLNNGAKIKISVKNGKIVEIDISDADGDKHHHIDWDFDVQIISNAISESAVKDRFFDGDSDEDSELTFSRGKVYDAIISVIIERIGKCDSFAGFRGEGSANARIIEAITPLYKYLKTIAIDPVPADEMLVDLLELNIERRKISNRIDKR